MKKILYIGENHSLTDAFITPAPEINYRDFDAIATLAPIATGKNIEVKGKPDIPLIHLSNIGLAEYADSTIVSIPNDRDTISLLLSIGIPQEKVLISENGHHYGVKSIASDMLLNNFEWESLRNIHKGRRAFVLGNGPSLRISDLHKLKNEITFASNKIYLSFEQTEWRPTYYTVCDQLLAQYNSEQISRIESMTILPSTLRKFNCNFKKGIWYDERFENKFSSEIDEVERYKLMLFFSQDIRFGVHGGYTVIYHQIQLAYHMGIRELYLIGVDFHFNIPSIIADDNNFESPIYRNALVCQGEVNHFHKEYRKPGEKWSMPRLDLQEHAFRTAKIIFQGKGGNLANASRHTALTALPRVDFDSIL